MNDLEFVNDCEKKLVEQFKIIDSIALTNQNKVLNAFRENKIALRHFAATTGYGYDDIGREGLSRLFSCVFKAERSIVSPNLVSGTHALACALYGILRPGDKFISLCGKLYDTLDDIITGEGNGSLKDFGIEFDTSDLKDDGSFDFENIESKLKINKYKLICLQRSRGYSLRNAFSIRKIREIIEFVRKFTDAPIMVDNCYGEFIDVEEPIEVGADIIVGSLIKNPGGGIVPTGAYICGKKKYIEQIENRFTAPGLATEVGSYAYGYQYYYQGFFLAPHIVAQCQKGSLLFREVFSELGYVTVPEAGVIGNDIITSVVFGDARKLIEFCRIIQNCAPIDSFVVPEPWDMPGYNDKIIMAAGAFVQGSSIELSADAPIREPFVAYLQGGLTYEHLKLAVMECLKKFK